ERPLHGTPRMARTRLCQRDELRHGRSANRHAVALVILGHDQYFEPSIATCLIWSPVRVEDLHATCLLACAWPHSLLCSIMLADYSSQERSVGDRLPSPTLCS